MRKLILSVALAGCAIFGVLDSVMTNVAGAADQSSTASKLAPVDVQEVSGLLNEIQVQAIEKALDRSAREGSQALILQVNTRGAVVSRERG